MIKHRNPAPAPGTDGHPDTPIRIVRACRLSDDTAAMAVGSHILNATGGRMQLHEQRESAWGAVAVIVAFALLCFTVGHTMGTINAAKVEDVR